MEGLAIPNLGKPFIYLKLMELEKSNLTRSGFCGCDFLLVIVPEAVSCTVSEI